MGDFGWNRKADHRLFGTDHGAKLHDLPDEHLAELLPIVKRIAIAVGAENYNVLQVSFVKSDVVSLTARGGRGASRSRYFQYADCTSLHLSRTTVKLPIKKLTYVHIRST